MAIEASMITLADAKWDNEEVFVYYFPYKKIIQHLFYALTTPLKIQQNHDPIELLKDQIQLANAFDDDDDYYGQEALLLYDQKLSKFMLSYMSDYQSEIHLWMIAD